MTSTAPITDEVREQIISQPEVILNDHEMMRALIAANERTIGANIIDFEVFLKDLGGEVAEILQVDCVRLVLESELDDETEVVKRLGKVLVVGEPGFVKAYIGGGRNLPPRPVTLRQVHEKDGRVYGESGYWIRSEACLRLDLGAGRLPGMLVLGVEDPHQFKPGQGTDLLAFFGGVFERSMRRWLA